MIPPAMMLDSTASQASFMVGKEVSSVLTAWGLRASFTVALVATPNVPSSHENADKIVARQSAARLPIHHFAGRRTTSSAWTWFVVIPYLKQ